MKHFVLGVVDRLVEVVDRRQELGDDLIQEPVEQVIGLELLAAAQGCDFHAGLASSDALEAVRGRLRAAVPMLDHDRHFHPDMEAATALVRGGAVAEAAGLALPGIA